MRRFLFINIHPLTKAVAVLGICSMLKGADYDFNLVVNSRMPDGIIVAKNGLMNVENVTQGLSYQQEMSPDGYTVFNISGIDDVNTTIDYKVSAVANGLRFNIPVSKDMVVKRYNSNGQEVPINVVKNKGLEVTSNNLPSGVYFDVVQFEGDFPFVVRSVQSEGKVVGIHQGEYKITVPKEVSKGKGVDTWRIISTPFANANFMPDTLYVYKDPATLQSTEFWENTCDVLPNERYLEGTFRDVRSKERMANVDLSLKKKTSSGLVDIANSVTDANGEYSFLVDLSSIGTDEDLFLFSSKAGYENSWQIEGDVHFDTQIDKIQKSSYPSRKVFDDDPVLDGKNKFRWKFNHTVNLDSLNQILDEPVDSLKLDYVKLPDLGGWTFTDQNGVNFGETEIVADQLERGYDIGSFDVKQAFATQGYFLNVPVNTGKKTKVYFMKESDDPTYGFRPDEIPYGVELLSEFTRFNSGLDVDYNLWYEILDSYPEEDEYGPKAVVVNKGPPKAYYQDKNDRSVLREGHSAKKTYDKGNIYSYLSSEVKQEFFKELERMFSNDIPVGTRSSVMQGTAAEPSKADFGEFQVNNQFDEPNMYWHDNGHKGNRFIYPFQIIYGKK